MLIYSTTSRELNQASYTILIFVCSSQNKHFTMSNQQLVQSKGIFHGLPVHPSSLKGLTAIITGANGISGTYMLRVLGQDPERWTKIYCLSRRPPAIPNGLPKNAEHIALDFLRNPGEIAEVLKERGVKADYVFFYSYVQLEPKEGEGLWSNAEEMCRVNGTPRLCGCSETLGRVDAINPLTVYSGTSTKFLRGPSTCQYQSQTHHAPDRREDVWGSPRPSCCPTGRNSTPRYSRAKLLLSARGLSLGFLQKA